MQHRGEAGADGARSVSRARQFVADYIESLGRADLRDDAVLVASELVTNAILHAGGLAEVRVVPLSNGVRTEVHDRTRTPSIGRIKEVPLGARFWASSTMRWSVPNG